MRRPELASRGRGRAHRLFHPLCGAAPDTLVRLLLRGGVRPGRAHVAALALGTAALRLPFTLAEAAASTALLRARPPGPAPVFVIGHWRSGTTHLANVLSRSPEFGILSPVAVGLPAEALGLARLAAPFIEQFFPRTRLIDDIALAPDLPQEDELAMANLSTLSCNHGLYFPARLQAEFDRGVFGDGVGAAELRQWARRLRHFVAKMTLAAGRPLLIRNPAYSARIPALRLIWPGARFIHIHRHPAEVCASFTRTVATLVRELSLGSPQVDAAALVRHVYPRLMTRLMRDAATLPPGCLAEIRYEDFRSRPVQELERVHRELDLPGFPAARPAFERYLGGLRHVPRQHRPDPAQAAWLAGCDAVFRHWDYELSDTA